MTHPARATYDAQVKARQDAFLVAYPMAGNIRKAAEAVGISAQAVYKLWTKDPDFMERLRLAQELHADYLEELALQKVERMESKDNLLHMMLLNGARPQKYRREGNQVTNQPQFTQIVINYPPGYTPPPSVLRELERPDPTIYIEGTVLPSVSSDTDGADAGAGSPEP